MASGRRLTPNTVLHTSTLTSSGIPLAHNSRNTSRSSLFVRAVRIAAVLLKEEGLKHLKE